MLENKHELLLPVGTVDMALAAIHNGADAIYVGFPGYNARGRAADLELEQLKGITEICHLHGVKVNLALNIVIFQDELERLVPLIEQVLPLKPDAVIVQDLGLARLLRKMAPNQAIHASTQMTVTNHEAIALLDDLNIKRFVLGRENSLREIGLIQAQTDQANKKELEVFVHGALCVSYSGQCFTSESLGGRSANRGQCAQSCRFGYEMFVDGEKRDLAQKQYLVSPQDLCGIAEIPALMDLGVHSFKVEGRLKSPEYVASATQEYRSAIDRHLGARDLSADEIAQSKERMATTYSRGFFTGWLHGVDHQRLVEGTGKSHRGYPIGAVLLARGNRMVMELEKEVELSPGDGLQWLYWTQTDPVEAGAQIYSVRPQGHKRIEIQFAKDVELQEEMRGARIFLNHVASQKRELKRSFHDKGCFKKILADITVEVRIGEPLRVAMSDGRFRVEAMGTAVVEEAKSKAVTDEFLQDELGALGGSVFRVGNFTVNRQGGQGIFYSHKELKEIRRKLTGELERLRAESRVDGYETEVASSEAVLEWMGGMKCPQSVTGKEAAQTQLVVLLREKAQVPDVVEAWQRGELDRGVLHAVILDFEFGIDYGPSIQLLREAGIRSGIATTRIMKPREYSNFTRIELSAPDIILVRNLGALHYFTAVKPFAGELRGDFSLNVTNHLSAQYLLSKGLHSVTASYDLNGRQVSELLAAADAGRLEITAHQYMPSFHMEHCVFAAFLSQGSSFRDCGKPCEKHRVELKDQFGNRHQIKPDQECRNTMYNAVPQSAARFVESWKKQGLGFIRYEALYERGAELIEKIRGYEDLLTGRRAPEQVISELKLLEKYGLGEGTIAQAHEYKSRKRTN